MARTLLDKELHELDAQITRLGSLVDDALAKALVYAPCITCQKAFANCT